MRFAPGGGVALKGVRAPRIAARIVSSIDRVTPPSRRTFLGTSVASLAALPVACRHHTPRVPTHPAIAGTTGSNAARGEILDTDDGPIPIDALDPQQGPADAHCVIVVFSDFQCPFCKDIAEVLARLRKELPRDLRVVFKHLPTSLHFHAHTAAVVAQVVFLEAGADAFWRFHDRCFAHASDIDEGVLAAWASDEGVAVERITARRNEAEKRVADDIALAERLRIHGTPHLYVNARTVAGAYPYEQMRSWVDEEL